MSYATYQLIHVISLVLLTAASFYALGGPTPERRKKSLILTGILSLTMLVGGFGLMARLKLEWDGWIFVKIACWIVLSALAGLAFRKPKSTCTLGMVGALAIAIAVFMVYRRPF
ncbi:MAG: SirB2 family protein [Planctomycetota bacterium]|nr:SirB2 family protein [Planctomycetota bacterium]